MRRQTHIRDLHSEVGGVFPGVAQYRENESGSQSPILGDEHASAEKFVNLGGGEGMFKKRQTGDQSPVHVGVGAEASVESPAEMRVTGDFVFLELGRGISEKTSSP